MTLIRIVLHRNSCEVITYWIHQIYIHYLLVIMTLLDHVKLKLQS